MAYHTILIESDQSMLDNMSSVLKKSPDFELAATYRSANAALGQSGMFQPNLFLIDVEDTESLEMIPAFVDIFPDSNILGLVSQWNADAAMNVIKGGGLGCILKPFKTNDITEALRLYKLRGSNGLSRIISFFSPKGRAGRTTMAAILALAIAQKSGERVALIDADLQFGDLPIFFDVEPKHTIVDATQDVKLLTPLNIEPYFHQIKKSVYLLSSPDRPEYAELVDVASLVDVVRLTCNLFKYVLIDLPAGFNPLSIGMCKLSDTVVVMAMINNGFEIQHVKRTLGVFKEQATRDRKIYTVFTRVNPCNEEQRLKIEQQLGYPVSDVLPNEYKMISIANSGRLSKGLPMDSLLMQNMSQIADDVINGKR